MSTSGFKENDGPLQGETRLEFERRVIDGYERRHALPKMTLELPLNDTNICRALLKNIYPDSEFDKDGDITVIKKSGMATPEFIYLEIGSARCRFRFNGQGHMGYENDVMTMNVEFVGFIDE